MSLRARQNGGGKVRNAGGRGGGNGSPGGRGNSGGGGDTWNPANKGASVTLSNSNLTAQIGGLAFQWALTTTSKTTGKWYAEVLVGAESNTSGNIAVVMATQNPTLDLEIGGLAQRGGGTWNPGGGVNGSARTNGDVIGIAVDVDARTVQMYKNGVANGSHSSPTVGARRIGVSQSWGTAAVSYTYTIRTTTPEFSYSPPTGYLPWGS